MSTNLKLYINSLQQKGNIAYEYNPLNNYQTETDLYKVTFIHQGTDIKCVGFQGLVEYGKAIHIIDYTTIVESSIQGPYTCEILTKHLNGRWINSKGEIITDTDNIYIVDGPKYEENVWSLNIELYAKAGSIIDLDTEQLNFDLQHPVNIEAQPSYDGSVNLIINDGKNIPRLINSRFSVREKNTYEIVDRIGENDTNVYNSETFEKDTSLYFQYETNPKIKYKGFIKGNLPVGQYCFYFTYCDADDNESDYIAESGLIPVFIGFDGDPYSVDGGIKNQNSNKGICLKLSNLDKSYNYFKVYYVRYFADYQQNRVYECKKIYQKYSINSDEINLQITGNENTEDIDANILNISRFNPKSVYTQAQCKNMLFFGNIVKNTDNYKELTDCALRIVPRIIRKNININNNDYKCDDYLHGYYSSNHIYNDVGYFNQEFYRFGVVFIYQNGTLSNVYNTLGGVLDTTYSLLNLSGNLFTDLQRNYIKIDDNGWIKEDSSYIITGNNINSKGVCKFNINQLQENEILGIKFNIPQEVVEYLTNALKIRGMFFVRQKCIPNILAQCFIMPLDTILEAPVIFLNDKNKFYSESFLSQKSGSEKIITNNYENRLYSYNKSDSVNSNYYVGLCPDFLLNQPYYNQIFNGAKFRLEEVANYNLNKSIGNSRIYNTTENVTYNKITDTFIKTTINTVTEDVPTVAINNQSFRLEIGKTEEAYRYGEVEQEQTGNDVYSSTNKIRGKYSPYLAIYSEGKLKFGSVYNIYQENSNSIDQEFLNRMNSSEPFYSISDRYNFSELPIENSIRSIDCWRGDSYINTFTHRLNRNFNDPSLPNNDVIIKANTWQKNYVSDQAKWKNISRSDLNAIQMGSWITFKVRSHMNYALRSQDNSYVSEKALMGSPRTYYPRTMLMQKGEYKIPDSCLYNDAYRASLGFKCYFTLNDINYIKNTFSNRIQYSAISIQDSFKNNYRYSLSTYFRDYSQEYGSITKLLNYNGHLLVIFEHAIGLAVINERILAGSGEGDPVFINTQNVLPEELTIISDSYGTQWSESVIKSDAGIVYGVDTVAKKIWKLNGQSLELISDFKVNKFLIDNLSLGERQLTPIIGLKNIKTHYNNNKKDVMFTFYNEVYKQEEKVWNLCYSELLGTFTTFYSWVPSYSENIDTQFFTFDRNTAKIFSRLKNDYYCPILQKQIRAHRVYPSGSRTFVTYYGFPLNNNFNFEFPSKYYKNGNYYIDVEHYKDGKYHKVDYQLNIENNIIIFSRAWTNDESEDYSIFSKKCINVDIIPFIMQNNIKTYYPEQTITFTDYNNLSYITTDFYLHGTAGIFDVVENLYPTYWYGNYHPFEFEFVVNDNIGYQKIFQNLVIISNKAEPESFHFEIEGDNYEFSSDKKTMYFRQEATKNLYQNLGSDILYDRKFTDVTADKYSQEEYYRSDSDEYTKQYKNGDKVYPVEKKGLIRQMKSTIFPLYYEKVDTYDDIYYKYCQMSDETNKYDFKNLSGSEIIWNRTNNQFNIITHVKNIPINLFGRIRGNSFYKEGKWNIQIPSIRFMQKNEKDWPYQNNVRNKLAEDGPISDAFDDAIPPIVINSQNIPSDLDDYNITLEKLPNIYTENEYVELSNLLQNDNGWIGRKETKIRDKWIKIRVRYSGKNLAIIHSIVTLYNISQT